MKYAMKNKMIGLGEYVSVLAPSALPVVCE